ncbi:MAG: copper amine oxidase N-terminal domain-containing protein [Defluviitaleaceae bacterium]|nr:copper amine oxidase N-terminal domain-containing protein [Defluviitaleaceae bacterium]
MKRKIALLLAVIMVVSLLPMNVFGRTVRPGVITPTARPHGVHDSPLMYDFQIDAAWLSEQLVPSGGRIFLEIVTSGGPSTGGNMVGMRGAANVGQRDPMNPAVPNTQLMTFSPGVGFAAGGNVTTTTSPTAIPFTLAMLADEFPPVADIVGMDDILDGLASGTAPNPPNLGGFWNAGSISTQITAITGLTIQNVAASGQLEIQFGYEGHNGQNPALWPSLLRVGSAANPLAPPVPAPPAGTSNAQNAFWQNYAGGTTVTVAEGAEAISNLTHIVGSGARPGTATGPEISYSDRRTSLALDARTGAPTSGSVWSRVLIDLEELVVRSGGVAGTGAGQMMEMSGMIDIQIPIQAGDPEATIRIRLGAINALGGAISWRGTLLEGPLTGGWSNGVSIESRGIIPLHRRGRLQPVRITEDTVGILGNRGLEIGHFAGVHTVRLVAPRGFRWDTQAMPGLGAGNLIVRGNSTVYGTDPDNTGRGRPLPFFNPQTGAPNSVYNWFNQVTDRDEIYLSIDLRNAHLNTIAADATRAVLDIEGLSLVAMPQAPTTGNVSIDVWVGGPPNWFQYGQEWAEVGTAHSRETWLAVSTPNPDATPPYPGGNSILGWSNQERFYRLIEEGFIRRERASGGGFEYQVRTPLFGAALESFRINNWRQMNLVVANLDDVGAIDVEGPATVFEAISGRPTGEFITNDSPGSNDRWMQGVNHTIRLTEIYRGAMFRSFDVYELRAVQAGVHIVDAQIRIGTVDDRGVLPWTRTDVTPQGDNINFVASMTEFDGGSMVFAPRTIETEHHPAGSETPDWTEHADELFGMDIRLMLSIEAGFEALQGSEVEFEVFRNNEYLGTVHVANVMDPIAVTTTDVESIHRDVFDVLPLTRVSSVTIEETEYDFFISGDEIWLGLHAVQLGRIIQIPHGQMALFLSDPVVNEDESGFSIREIPGTQGLGWRVVRPSQNGVPGSITFDEVFVAGPTVPGVEWRVVVHGPEITENHLLPEEENEVMIAGRRYLNETARWIGFVSGAENAFTGAYAESRFYSRAAFHSLPYGATVLEVTGRTAVGDVEGGPDNEQPGGFIGGGAVTFHANVPIDGIYPVIFHAFSSTFHTALINPRVFADHYGLTSDWSDANQTFTFSGMSRTGEQRTVITTLGSTNIVVDGVTHDIATLAGQGSELGGMVAPILIAGRQYVPARVIADVFGIPITAFNINASISFG